MSSEIIIILIGVVLILLAVGDSITIKNSPLNLLNNKLRIPMGIIGFSLILFGGYSYDTISVPAQIEPIARESKKQVSYPIKTVQVISPIEGDSVSCRILTMGVYPESHNKDIWVLLKPSDEKYYPQSDDTNTSYKRNGEWQVITRFGGDQGEAFDIIVYETDSMASQYFSSTIASWKAADSYPGIEEEDLPSGALEVDRVMVYLKENCRGVH
jgi:hypothetical protein